MSTSFLSCRDVTVNLGPSTILSGVGVSVGPGDRLALVGPNGVGKTTLLRVLSGDVTPDQGVIDRPSTVGLMPQERDARGEETLRAYLARRTGAAEADAELVTATEALAAGAPNADQRYADALDRYLALGAADLDVRAPAVLAELGLDPERLDDPVRGLSGGQLARLALASVLLAQYDVLLLDEPTNDLDVAGLERLERFVLERTGALVLVSHDRRFLERVTTGVLEIDWYTREGRVFGGGYAAYLEERERARQHAWEAYETYVEKRDALVAQARKQREWARTAVAKEKRNPNDGDKMLRDAKIERTERTMAKASAADRALERLEVVEEPRTPWELRLSLEQQARSGDRVAGLAGAVCRRGDFTLGPVDLDVRYADRLVITGPNGSGKSTLVGALLGRLPLDEGERWFGRGVVVGEIDQVQRGVDPNSALVAAFRAASGYDETEARRLLAKFDLDADDVVRPTGSLSPGERTRADLALLVARQSNLIVLDEPTNHLDLPAVEQLEQALTAYDGTLVLVSHDRHLAEAVGATHLVRVENGQVSVDMPASSTG